MNIVFLMDPLSTVKAEKDTTYILMLGAQRHGHRIFYLPEGGITRISGKTFFAVTEVDVQTDIEHPFAIRSQEVLNESQVDVLWIRTDPPFDADYLMQTWLLDLLDPRIIVLNRPSGIRTVNEKVWATQFVSIIPPTLISRNKIQILAFIKEHQEIVIKPANGYGGQGVLRFKNGDQNMNVGLEISSDNFRREIIVQKYLPEAQQGDKRILLLNGEPLGAVLRVHTGTDHRNNFFAGGKPHATEITQRDHEIIKMLKPYLQELGLYFVGIDIMGGYLIEVNVTSPTCLQEMNELYKVQLEDQVTAFVDKLAAQKRL